VAETGGDATGDSVVAPLGVAPMETSKGAEAGKDATGDSVVAALGVAAMGACAGEGAFDPARLRVAAMGASAGEGAFDRDGDFATEGEVINPKAKAKTRIA